MFTFSNIFKIIPTFEKENDEKTESEEKRNPVLIFDDTKDEKQVIYGNDLKIPAFISYCCKIRVCTRAPNTCLHFMPPMRCSLHSAFGTQPLPDALPVAHPHSSQLTQETNEMHAATASDWHSHSHDVKCVDRQPIDYHKTADDIMSNWIKPPSILTSGNDTAVDDPPYYDCSLLRHSVINVLRRRHQSRVHAPDQG